MNQTVATTIIGNVTALRGKDCPRCTARLFENYDEMLCVRCGCVDYNVPSPRNSSGTKNALNAAILWIVRYVGDSPLMKNDLLQVRTERSGYCIAYKVTCPYCNSTMSQSSRRSSKRIEKREERHRCNLGHIITLRWDEEGDLGWR
jgi:hypothetical protein